MAGHIVFEGMNINNIAEEIQVRRDITFASNDYLGGVGSSTDYVSESGNILTFSSLCLNYEESLHGHTHRIEDYKELNSIYSKKQGVVTSQSNANINGNYIITNFEITEDTGGNFKINWELKEQIPFNVTKQTFRVWGSAAQVNNTKTSTATKTTTKKVTSGSNISSNTKYLLKTCGLMSKGSKATKCVKVLQKFLQAGGYYKGYKLDGVYGVYTVKEMKKVQKKRGLKQTGNWDKATRAYYQKKYKYP